MPSLRAAFRLSALAVAAVVGAAAPARAVDIDADPIRYATTPANNAASRLDDRLRAGKATLAWDDKFGYLPALLRELRVPTSSQALVFSKTSFQRERINPTSPRALYFNDEVYVGYCRNGKALEVTAVDPTLGAVFYTVPQAADQQPVFQRQDDSCLICHGSSQNQGVPGHLLRSVYPDAKGFPILPWGGFRTDQTSPLKDRWGGWYVTGKSGRQTHLGNKLYQEKQRPEENETRGVNLTDVSDRTTTTAYLTGHSDIVALMVLEHQTEMHNRIARAGFLTRQAVYEQAEIDKAFGQPNQPVSESTRRRINNACEPLVRYLLFSGEAPLTDPVEGTSGFAEEFVKAGPRDERKRSLRDLDLKTRLFAYPCSYLIYSEAFDALPDLAKARVYLRLGEVLSGKDASKEFAHLSAEDRQAILEILRATKKGLPESFRQAR